MLQRSFENLWTIQSRGLRSLLDLQYSSIRQALKREIRQRGGGSRLLDFGSGPSPYQDLFPGQSIETLDPLFPATYRSLADLPDEKRFDRILLIEVLEHVRSPEEILNQLAPHLSPGGEIWISVPFAARIHRAPEDYHRWTDSGLALLAEKGGLELRSIHPRGNGFSAQCARFFFALFQWARHPLGFLPALLLGTLTVPWLLPLAHLSHLWLSRRSEDPLGFFAVATRSPGGDKQIAPAKG